MDQLESNLSEIPRNPLTRIRPLAANAQQSHSVLCKRQRQHSEADSQLTPLNWLQPVREYNPQLRVAIGNSAPAQCEFFTALDGHPCWNRPRAQASGNKTWAGTTKSIKGRKSMETAHEPHELNEIFSHFPDSVLLVNLCDEILYANPAGLRLLCRLPHCQGYLPAVLNVVSGHCEALRLRDIAGTQLILEIKCQHIIWQEAHVKLLLLCDRTRVMQRQRELEQLVNCDELTGLYNRRGLDLQVSQLQKRADGLRQKLYVLFIDVNGLKQINDTHGHSFGDAALVETAEVIRQGFAEDAIKARIGGDEFVVFQLENSHKSIHRCLDRIQSCLDRFNNLEGRPFRLTLSIGMSEYYPGQIFDLPQLLQLADQNMYRAKAEYGYDRLPPLLHRLQRPTLQVVALNAGDKTDTATLYA
jgi:diguanylate cyclase (GGDEF)-like protein